jgi:FlaA1/EpsC-like NDP-sugar epimerase
VVVDNCEANLYAITEEIDQIVAGEPSLVAMQFVPVLCSVNDRARIRQLLENYPVDAIYHAAAYKHVPIVERFPGQAIDVNVLGTLNMVESAIEARVRTFMLISTDKAVRPTNAMGASKRVAELILQAKAQLNHETTISMVRFGNVLGSSGSVVPKFRKQIKEGGPVTITHSDITRYFMTIPEASQLVLQASAIARGGEVFVLDMGEPVAIRNLAETMIRLHRRRTEMAGGQAADVQIKVIGLRPGEKMYEELFIDGNIEETLVPKVLMANECYLEWAQLEPMLNELKALPVGLSPAQLKGKLLDLISHPALTKSAESYSEVGIGESGAEKFQLEVY